MKELDRIVAFFKARFPNLRDSDVMQIMQISQLVTIKKDDYITRIGDFKPFIALIFKGIVRCVYFNKNGEENTPFFWAENQFFAPWENIYFKQPSEIDFQAIEDCLILKMDFIKFKKIIPNYPRLQQMYISALEETLANTLHHQQNYINEKPERRYELFLEKSLHIANRITQKHMSSHLGITPISLSRIKRRLEDDK